ncbi:MAG: AAA family ATPase [Holosporaceae bacterium]|jgi:DNA polymerase-3 subunit delta'|nr:AAA family ATPase [Holosporaceae bacterium]
MISIKTLSVLGHEKEEAVLHEAIAHDKVFPTWIFHGPFGVGKSSIAYKFAKCLLSGFIPANNTLDIPPENPIHKLVDLRIHPDFFVLEQSNESISIDDTRKLLLKIRKSPSVSQRRVLVLENFSNLNKNIYNSLLKMLEEPPQNSVVIMICNNIGIIPKTLLSRVAKIYFTPLNKSLVKQILDSRDIKNSESLARLSEGSVGYALHLNDNNGIEIYNNILKGFSSIGNLYQKTLKWIIDNNLCDNFEIIKTSILRILKIYIAILSDTADENYEEEIKILEPIANAKRNYLDREIKKIQEIIFMIGLCDPLILDRNAVIANTFERFFK